MEQVVVPQDISKMKEHLPTENNVPNVVMLFLDVKPVVPTKSVLPVWMDTKSQLLEKFA